MKWFGWKGHFPTKVITIFLLLFLFLYLAFLPGSDPPDDFTLLWSRRQKYRNTGCSCMIIKESYMNWILSLHFFPSPSLSLFISFPPHLHPYPLIHPHPLPLFFSHSPSLTLRPGFPYSVYPLIIYPLLSPHATHPPFAPPHCLGQCIGGLFRCVSVGPRAHPCPSPLTHHSTPPSLPNPLL